MAMTGLDVPLRVCFHVGGSPTPYRVWQNVLDIKGICLTVLTLKASLYTSCHIMEQAYLMKSYV